MAKKKALGRGLSALISDTEKSYENSFSDNSELIVEIDIDSIKPNPFQPRNRFNNNTLIELSNSIKEHGLLQPILIYEDNNEYFLIAGERRLRASKIAEITSIKCIIVDIDVKKLRELALIENIQREDLNPIDLARSYNALIQDYNITQDALALKLQKSRPQITNTIALLRLPSYVQDLLIEGNLSQGHAKVLVNLDDNDCKLVVDSVIGQKLSVRETEQLVKNIKNNRKSNITYEKHSKSNNIDNGIHNELIHLSNIMIDKFEINSKISNNSITLSFGSAEIIKDFINFLDSINFRRK